MKVVVGQLVHRRAPAKVNLTLAVLDRRSDGYHDIESWVVPVGLYDELTFTPAPELQLTVHGAGSAVPADGSNLVCRAARALAQAADRAPAAAIRLEKRIPAGAGLGGGSSDAAATLSGLNSLWSLDWPVEQMMAVAERLGSDVPLFMEPGSAVIRGRGERVERLAVGWRGWLALILPRYGNLTGSVYRRWRPGAPTRSAGPPAWERLPRSAVELSSRLFNDLEAAAFAYEPRLAGLHAALNGLDGRPVRMTGSGSCLFAIFDSGPEAAGWKQRAMAHLQPGDAIHTAKTL